LERASTRRIIDAIRKRCHTRHHPGRVAELADARNPGLVADFKETSNCCEWQTYPLSAIFSVRAANFDGRFV
jgi:hypothetical protein